MASEHHPAGRHEMTDANISALVKFGIGLALMLVAIMVAMVWMFDYFSTSQKLGPPASPFAESRQLPPGPRLQVHPAVDLKNLLRDENEKLNSYGWVDKQDGIARIPIDRAMDLLLKNGLPVRPGTPTKPMGKQK
jgi:hypothetical protein